MRDNEDVINLHFFDKITYQNTNNDDSPTAEAGVPTNKQ